MRIAAAVIGCLVVGLAWAGCSSTDNHPSGAGGSGGSAGAGGKAGGPTDSGRDPNLNCVKPGTPNNEKGVGGYCESSAECQNASGGFFICSGDFDTTPRYAWFCTTFCTIDADCGSNAYCGHSDLGGGCVPYGCGAGPEGGYPDTGADTATDGRDASTDVAADRGPDVAPEAAPDVVAEGSADVATEVTLDVAAEAPADAPPEAAPGDGATD